MKKYMSLVIIIGFIATLLWVEVSPWSSSALKDYNGGYGTFDMKTYDYTTVSQVLERTEEKGFEVYRLYLVGDYLFILFFGALQINLLLLAYRWCQNKRIKRAILFVPILRGIFDLIENTLLLHTLNHYPDVKKSFISTAHYATSAKLSMIALWIGLLVLGIVLNRLKNKKHL